MDERDRGQGSLSDKVKGSYRRVSVVMYVTLVIAAIAVFAAAYVPKQFSLAYTILVLIVFLITAVNDTRLIQRNSPEDRGCSGGSGDGADKSSGRDLQRKSGCRSAVQLG